MTKSVTVLCSISAVPGGWRIDAAAPAGVVLPWPRRDVLRVGTSPAGFPLPPDAEIQALPPAARALLPALDEATLRKHYGNCLRGEPAPGQVAAFGRYLTAVLLGPDNLRALDLARPLELQLRLPANDVEMNRLPWEMMHGSGSTPLVGELARDVAITRLVDGPAGGAPPELEPLEIPLRVLFVIGRQLDAQVRPGAEYIGLLRQMKIGTGPAAAVSEMHTRLLVEATTEELAGEVNRFRPHVVHFICHGGIGRTGGCLLLTRRGEPGKPTEAEPCDGATLLGLLRQSAAPHRLPAIVVLNACHSSDAAGGADLYTAHQSLGAQMVAGGVAAAVGMAGEVADGACRLFTHRFYHAVLNQEGIALAAANGRRAALVHFKDMPENVEWARPTLFLRRGADAALTLAKQDEARVCLAAIPQKFRLTAHMPLCDRVSILQEWEAFRAEWRAGSAQQVLALGVEEDESYVPEFGRKQFGKSWLLEEIAARSVLDGFVPCFLASTEGTDVPGTLLSFAFAVAEAMDVTRVHFGLPKTLLSHAFKQVYKTYGQPPATFASRMDAINVMVATRKLAAAVGRGGAPADIGVDVLRGLLTEDYKALLQEVEARYGGTCHPLLLIDDFHRYEGTVGPILHQLVDARGVGSPAYLGSGELAIPLVFTHSAVSCTNPEAGRLIREFKIVRAKYCRPVALKRIGEGEESRLACSQYLLYRPKQPLATSSRRDARGNVELFYKKLQRTVDGVPSFLRLSRVQDLIELAQDIQALVEADEEIIFKSLI